ncbi:natural resistance-associated macrophage protein [Coprinopsis marcescibilis]|uniref:Natural resistance-associated macrophage protein n=1 Tax=Coprinopsis marcescibilis TaxID=230819 RepID=A0A5C3KM84_COPMA|nr:natural resistance-associated macrophage protein [Coprinopsis marcescibilis]
MLGYSNTTPPAGEPAAPRRPWSERLKQAGKTTLHHLKKHTGVGAVCAVAYFDPGNWGVDLAAGSQFGYRLLFVVLLAGIFAVYLQILASRLGCVTGVDLAGHSRLLLYNRPKNPRLWRWLALYPLYVLAEVAIIATDLAELLGSAIALCMLFPRLELWHGVLITAFDVIIILAFQDPLRGRPVRWFEALIAAMVVAVLVCMVIVIAKLDVHWGDAFFGYVPSKYIFQSGGLYTSVGILGATVMPHSLFIGSALATQDRIEFREMKKDVWYDGDSDRTSFEGEALPLWKRVVRAIKKNVMSAFSKPPPSFYSQATKHSEHENNPYAFVRAHIYHGIIDVAGSLLGFAVLINSLILILASAVFFYGDQWSGNGDPASLFDCYDLIRDLVGQSAATLFAVSLLASGQSSSLIATVAGQAVSEGFLKWRVSPIVRRLLTRLLAIIPSMTVAVVVGRQGIDALLVASQVVLSVVLPFITFPLLYCTASKAIMTVKRRKEKVLDSSSSSVDLGLVEGDSSGIVAPVLDRNGNESAIQIQQNGDAKASADSVVKIASPPGSPTVKDSPQNVHVGSVEGADEYEYVDYSNNKLTIAIGIVIWLVVVAANVYVLIDLAIGAGSG